MAELLKFSNTFLVEKHALSNCSVTRQTLPRLEEYQILLKIEKVGFSANNITYMALGEAYQYFAFFSEDNEPVSTVPVWGIAVVEQSKHAKINVGERIYGYFPLSQYIILRPDTVKPAFFRVQRPRLPADRAVYHQYFRAVGDVEFEREKEEYMCIYRPLWGTSFFLDDFLHAKQWFGGDVILVSSASSKTAYCFALLQQDRKGPLRKKLVGLTSSGNLAFVKSLGWYDFVVDYKDLEEYAKKSAQRSILYVDLAGNQKLNATIHRVFNQSLVKQVTVGMSHFSDGDRPSFDASLIDTSKVTLFFAPEWIQSRNPRDGEDLVKRRSIAWKNLLDNAHICCDLKIVQGSGLRKVYLEMLEGKSNPRDGLILSMWS